MKILGRRVCRKIPLLIVICVPLLLFSVSLLLKNSERSSPHMIIILSGRLGNQLFQVAASKYISKRFGKTRVSYLRNKYSEETDFSSGILQDLHHVDDIYQVCEENPKVTFHQERMDCSDLEPKQVNECLVVEGLFQCPNFVHQGVPLIRKILHSFNTSQNAIFKRSGYLEGLSYSHIVSVHVRRGDYIKKFNRNFLSPLPIDYYSRAITHMPENSLFLIFSDDIKWCAENILPLFQKELHRSARIVDEDDPTTAIILMSLSDHFIIANSTFSWWAAFLGASHGKIVVAPKKWFGSRVKSKPNIYPKNWITI